MNPITESQEPLNIQYIGVSELMAAMIGMAQALKRFLIAKRRAREQPLSTAVAFLPVTRAVAVTRDDLRVTVYSGKRKRDLTENDGAAIKRHRCVANVQTAQNPETLTAPGCSSHCNEKNVKVMEPKNVQERFRAPHSEWRPFGKPCSPSLAIAPKTNMCKPVAVVRPSVIHQTTG